MKLIEAMLLPHYCELSVSGSSLLAKCRLRKILGTVSKDGANKVCRISCDFLRIVQ